jgi:hypothetical protein
MNENIMFGDNIYNIYEEEDEPGGRKKSIMNMLISVEAALRAVQVIIDK